MKNKTLSPQKIEQFGTELDNLRHRIEQDLGEKDARYIHRIIRLQRYMSVAGRGLLFAGMFLPAWIAGALLLGIAKILENMEIGHNVMHGQYDWMRDPRLNGKTYEWDIVGTADNWRKTHNYEHHTYTNIKGKDKDLGYGIIRLFPEQRWKPFYLFQPIYSILFALLFQWGVAIQDLELGAVASGKKDRKEFKAQLKTLGKKVRWQLLRDYLFFPLLAGPFFLYVFTGNLVANGIRNVWTFTVIFCGHFTRDVTVFPKEVLGQETRGQWYLRQIQGSSNLSGGKVLHIMTGNLSHQIEHHLFPDIPAGRYAEMAVEVRAICQRYGIHYNTGSMPKQFGQVIWRIVRYSLPGKKTRMAPLPA